jgi:hypothetical protein
LPRSFSDQYLRNAVEAGTRPQGITKGTIMKSTALITSIAILAAVFSVAANAQTGRPSVAEAPTSASSTRIVSGDQDVGSYARYLMLNGTTRDEAIQAARNIDHPAPRKVAVRTDRPHAGATAPVQQ